MLYGFLIVLLVIVALALAGAVLLQAGQGGGLASLGGSGGTGAELIVGNRQAATILTKATWWLGGTLLVLSILIGFARPDAGAGSSAIQEQLRKASQPQPAAPTGLLGGGAQAPAQGAAPATQGQAPAAPAQPAAPAPATKK
ncbi:MAG: preprotein translocase subunit SecG [Gemmatimonadales bacterium]|nr:preprotein translocase subunit SecG [Gemmatimonadales bacterium]